MNSTLLNNTLTVSYPDGFHVVDESEEKQLFLEQSPDRWAIWDKGRHIVFTVQWHESNKLMVKLADTKDLAKRIRSKARKAYKNMGYSDEELFKTELCGKKTWGLRYGYAISGVEQVAEAYVLKHEACTYSFSYVARKEHADESHKILEEILSGIELS